MVLKFPFMPADAAPRRKAARKKETFDFSVGKSSLGLILVALSEFGIVSVIAGTDKQELIERLQDRFRSALLREDKKKVAPALAEVIRHIDAPRSRFNLPLDIRGTVLQQRIWRAVRKIPAGETSTYADIARIAGAPRAMRAVGSTCTNNRFFIVVPCHRVLHTGETANNFHKASQRQQMLIGREAKA